MAKHTSPMRLNEQLVKDAQIIGSTLNRTTAEQIEYWSEVGKRVSANLTHAQVISLFQGSASIKIETHCEQEINPFDVANEVNADTSLSHDLHSQGNVLYSPNTDMTHVGTLKATFPNGEVKFGNFVNGNFVAERAKSE
ncbi:TA system antitoxin ParD family protein [Agaribacter flavus]|uniref:ParD-like antitoxin of type II toxin-antitoxin system n=1 Tax=Agaribacter flavus TaxID=1902781 RepID=A0ABV7FMW0_9ALTE